MPVYPFKCTKCDYTVDILEEIRFRNKAQFCPNCGSLMRHAMELQKVTMRGDIEPGYDESLGEYVGSRRELREKLAFSNAYCPDLMQNPEPQAGRLTPEEKAEVLERKHSPKKTIFERRKESGWDQPTNDDMVMTEGVADYSQLTQYIKESSNAARVGKN
jgi:putative FmdB family regulatory protein